MKSALNQCILKLQSLPMFAHRHLRRASILALFVLFWGLAFPSLAKAGVGGTSAVWAEICTAQGIKKLPQSEVATSQTHAATAEHCVLCCLGGSLPGSPELVWLSPLQIALALPLVVAPAVFTPQPLVLVSSPPRAPPLSLS